MPALAFARAVTATATGSFHATVSALGFPGFAAPISCREAVHTADFRLT